MGSADERPMAQLWISEQKEREKINKKLAYLLVIIESFQWEHQSKVLK